jgi:hypothetical protein
MSRKNVIKPYQIINAGDMSGDITSASTNTQYLDNVGLIAEWTGTSPVGTITVEVQNGDSAWSELNFGTTIAVSGNTGNHNININELPFEKYRVKYNFTSGVGTLTVYSTAKMI